MRGSRIKSAVLAMFACGLSLTVAVSAKDEGEGVATRIRRQLRELLAIEDDTLFRMKLHGFLTEEYGVDYPRLRAGSARLGGGVSLSLKDHKWQLESEGGMWVDADNEWTCLPDRDFLWAISPEGIHKKDVESVVKRAKWAVVVRGTAEFIVLVFPNGTHCRYARPPEVK